MFFTWLILTRRTFLHRNFKTSKCRSALSSKVKTSLEAALIQSKGRKLIASHLERQISLSQASKRELTDEWGCWSPRMVGRVFSVLLHELLQKCNDFGFSLYLTAETTLMQNEMTYIIMFHNSAISLLCILLNAVYFFSTHSIRNKQS